jgi:hypothetical protein
MFGSQILEVGIGLILIFLLVSLILTAVRETIESWMRSRSLDLERAIAELLSDQGGDGLRRKLYEHPLISGLYKGSPQLTNFLAPATWGGWLKSWMPKTRTNLPSYIPRETFAAALHDIMSKADEAVEERVETRTKGGKAAEPKASAPTPPSAGSSQVQSDSTGPSLMTGLADTRRAYAALAAAADQRGEVVLHHLEGWYDAAMDRASGWFKRRTQTILLFLGFAIALAFNINAVTVAQYLATDDIARAQATQVASKLLDDRQFAAALAQPDGTPSAAQAPTPAVPGGATMNEAISDQSVTESNASDPSGRASGNVADPAPQGHVSRAPRRGAPAASGAPAPSPPQGPALTRADAQQLLQGQLEQAGLPIGWTPVQIAELKAQFQGRSPLVQLCLYVMLCAGWVAVGFAATLGAPFWFDLLDKFMVVRSTVKPTEKSPDEGSKNSQGGAASPAADGDQGGGGPRGPADSAGKGRLRKAAPG